VNFIQRLEALEAAKAAARMRAEESVPKSARERAEIVHSGIWITRVHDERCKAIAPPLDGYWPYLPGGYGADMLLQVSGLQAMFDATGDEALGVWLRMADGRRPISGGEVKVYFDEGDDVPLFRFWFEADAGADLL
jgi:hypothetical protein